MLVTDIIVSIGVGLVAAWITGMVLNTAIRLAIYKFDKRNYTHPKWHTLFPYIFTIQYKVELRNGQNLISTTTPHLLEIPFLGDSRHKITREIYTEKYMNSIEFKKLRAGVKQMVENQRKNQDER